MATPSERSPSRMMIPCSPFLTQTTAPTSLLAASSSPPPPPNTSRSRLPILTCVNLSRVQAVRDPLTGLYNPRYMQEFLDRELHSARRKRRPLAVMMLDLDHFKRYNNHFGHCAGDQALAAVGGPLRRCVRSQDRVGPPAA